MSGSFFDCAGGGALTIFRWAFVLMNIVFFISGISIITIGSIILDHASSLDDFSEENINLAAIIILITTGVFTFLFSIVGCYGAIKKLPRKMFVYSGVVFVLFAAQLAGGVAELTYKNYFTEHFKDTMQKYMAKYMVNGNGEQAATDAWDNLQRKYECCGTDIYMDWFNFRPELTDLPDSCNCDTAFRKCVLFGSGNIYGKGCYTKLEPFLKDLINAMGGIAIGTSILHVVAAGISIFLGKHFKKGRIRGSV